MTLHVIFTAGGIPGWFGPEPVAGSVPVEGIDPVLLLTHRRTARGKWVLREPEEPAEPSPQEVERLASEAHAAALAARDEALRDALAREADPLFFKWQAGEIPDQTEWLETRKAIKDRFPRPEPG